MLKVISVEIRKLKGSFALFVAILMPVAVVAFGTANYVHYRDIFVGNPWYKLYVQVIYWYVLMLLPLSIALITMLVCNLERTGNGWKQILTLPVSREAIYLAKVIMALALIGLSIGILAGGYLLAGAIIGINTPVQWSLALVQPLKGFIATWPVVALQLWLAVRFERIFIPIGVGIVAAIAAIFAANSRYGIYFMWTYPQYIMAGSTGEMFKTGMKYVSLDNLPLISVVLFVMITTAGLLDFRRREIY